MSAPVKNLLSNRP